MIKVWTLVGVSTDGQAREEKDSIPDQLRKCREFIEKNDCVEVGHSIMDGYSRNDYDSLEIAMHEIPPLAEAIDAAESNQYDILLLDNYERLGDLGLMVGARFRRLKKQIHSIRQSGRLIPPGEYDPYASEAGDIDMYIEGIINRYRNNKLRRGWTLGISKRIADGLVPFNRAAYGYTKTDKKTPPVQNSNTQYILKMKDWLFEGRPLLWIAEELTRLGAPTPNGKNNRWHVESIRHILLNPFYAGIVAIGQKKRERVSKNGRRYRARTPQSSWKQSMGGHVPLWDEATYLAIQNEFSRRMGLKNYAKTTYPLAGLLRCSVCKQKLSRRWVSGGGHLVIGLGCHKGPSHVRIQYDKAIQLLGKTLKDDLQKARHNAPAPEAEAVRLRTSLDQIREQRQLVQAGYQAKIYSQDEAAAEISKLEFQEKTAQTQLDELEDIQQNRSQARAFADILLQRDDLAEWIADDDPVLVNTILSSLGGVFWVTPEHQLTVDWP